MREQAEDVFGMEARIQDLDAVLVTTRQQVQAARCECGAPLVYGSHFCANCGRPTSEAVVSCTNCGHPLPADARFCGNCGTAAPSSAERQAQETPPAASPSTDQPAAAGDTGGSWRAEPAPEAPRDPWEQ